jgi:hypothetical protein
MMTTLKEARQVFDKFQNESAENYANRVGFDVAEKHLRSEFIQKAAEFARLLHEVGEDFDPQAMEDLICLSHFVSIRGNAYAEVVNKGK